MMTSLYAHLTLVLLLLICSNLAFAKKLTAPTVVGVKKYEPSNQRDLANHVHLEATPSMQPTQPNYLCVVYSAVYNGTCTQCLSAGCVWCEPNYGSDFCSNGGTACSGTSYSGDSSACSLDISKLLLWIILLAVLLPVLCCCVVGGVALMCGVQALCAVILCRCCNKNNNNNRQGGVIIQQQQPQVIVASPMSQPYAHKEGEGVVVMMAPPSQGTIQQDTTVYPAVAAVPAKSANYV